MSSAPSDSQRKLFINYLSSVFYSVPAATFSQLSTNQLTDWYRSLSFFYICTIDTQPDGGWQGAYWKEKINNSPVAGPDYNWTNIKNEVFLYDDRLVTGSSIEPSAASNVNHSAFWGNRIFADFTQESLRRGMRNSPQVLNGADPNPKYGTGGFPANVYIEMLMFPQEHGNSNYPSGCDAQAGSCAPSSDSGSNPNNEKGPETWFYYSKGNGMFWDIGKTAYCYNYIDMFLNCPPGTGGELAPIAGDPVQTLKNILGYLYNKPSYSGTYALSKQVGHLMGKNRFEDTSPNSEDYYDEREYITGWCNGDWFGYPKGSQHFPGGLAPFGRKQTEDNPFVYYDCDGNEIAKTWHGMKLDLSEDVACMLVAEMYSCGDTGWDDAGSNWPFGSFFSYGEDLGVGKYWVGQKMSGDPWDITTVQFTMTPTSLSASTVVMPAYDFEIMYFQSYGTVGSSCVSAMARTMDPALQLQQYLNQDTGRSGGYLNKSANPQLFNGKQLRLSNFTTSENGDYTFDPSQANDISGFSNNLMDGKHAPENN